MFFGLVLAEHETPLGKGTEKKSHHHLSWGTNVRQYVKNDRKYFKGTAAGAKLNNAATDGTEYNSKRR